jgi:enediyne biosynthesis protein E4
MRSMICSLLLFLVSSSQLHAQLFTKITEGPLVNDDRYSEGSAWGDVNNDNYLDVFVPDAFAERSNLLFLNNGDGTFKQVVDGPVVTDTSRSSGCSFGDFDNDGFLDLFAQNWEGMDSHLYMNDGDGTFTKVTSGQIVSDGGWSFNSSVVDYDNDGNLDIYVDNGAFTASGESNFLYHGNGDGTFDKIVTGDLVNDDEHSLGSSWCDYDNDGDQDLFTANSDPFNGVPLHNFLYENNGDGTFTKQLSGIIVEDVRISIGGSWGDYDNDGDFDLFVANWYGEDNQLYRNDGDGSFARVTTGSIVNDGGNSVSGAWGDYDNDGHLDLYVTNDWNENNFLYRNNGDGTFLRITQGEIVNDGGRSNGATWADYNNDGYLDMFVPNGQSPPQSNFLYRNNGLSGNNWINVRCVGTLSNVSAVGTRLRASAVISGQTVCQLREVGGHQGFNSQESFNVEFGLAQATMVDSLIIEWPSGLVEIFADVEADKFYLAVEGEGLSVVTSITEDPKELLPAAGIQSVFPNPFETATSIRFFVEEPGIVEMVIYDCCGRRLRNLADVPIETGQNSVSWDGMDDSGNSVPGGVYFCVLRAGGAVDASRVILLR